MLYQFELEKIRLADDDGALLVRGVEWRQSTGLNEPLEGLCALASVPVVFGFVLLCALGPALFLAILILGGLAVMACLCIAMLWTIDRSVTFDAASILHVPHWCPTFVPRGLALANTFEIRTVQSSAGVVLTTSEGDTIWIAKNLQHADAHKLAVQLQQALEEMRVALSAPAAAKRDRSRRAVA